MRTPFRYGNRLFSLAGQLLIFPALKDFIADVFGYDWDRNRAIDSKGNHNNALMGGYLLAVSNTTVSIVGLLTTDTIKALTKDGLVGTIAVGGIISFVEGSKYGAFEIYRGTTLIGRYCLTERQGLQIINQITGGLPNGLLGGTTTTVWQRSNAFYSETNERGYSISGTGWVTSTGASLTIGTIIPADPTNPTKCMAWVSSVQQDLQFVGKARNSVSVVPYAYKGNSSVYWRVANWGGTVTSHKIVCYFVTNTSGVSALYDAGTQANGSLRSLIYSPSQSRITLFYSVGSVILTLPSSVLTNTPVCAEGLYNNGKISIKLTNLQTNATYYNEISVGSVEINIVSARSSIGITDVSGSYRFTCVLGLIEEYANNILVNRYLPNQHGTSYINTINKVQYTATGTTTNLHQNVDLVNNIYNQTGYELWYNGTDYRIYPLSSTGTRIITPAGYEWQETVTAGNMPSIADIRMSTFKYALANSYAVIQSVPEAFNPSDPCAPKLLTFSELSALDSNIKVTKTEANGKITNLTIRQ